MNNNNDRLHLVDQANFFFVTGAKEALSKSCEDRRYTILENRSKTSSARQSNQNLSQYCDYNRYWFGRK